MKIKSKKFNFWWDVFGFTVISLLGLSAHIVDDRVPNITDSFIWISSETWRSFHGLTGIMLLTFVTVHILLHWKWIWSQFRRVGE